MRSQQLDHDWRDAVALAEANRDLQRSRHLHGVFINAHEGHSVIMEEFLKLQEIVFMHGADRNLVAMRTEALHLAAMALKFVSDLTPIQLNPNTDATPGPTTDAEKANKWHGHGI